MKDPIEVLHKKQAQVERLREEIAALHVVGRLLCEEAPDEARPKGAKVIQMPAAERA